MYIQFLGIGNAFSTLDFHSNALLTDNQGNTLLIDCGSDIKNACIRANISTEQLSTVFVSHAHADHTGGLEWLGFSRYFTRQKKTNLIAYHELMKDIESMLGPSMICIDEFPASLNTYFNQIPVHHTFECLGTTFEITPVLHTTNFGKINPCHGLFFSTPNHRVWFTADLRFDFIKHRDLYETASIIFHDCETTTSRSTVHPHIDDLNQLPPHVKKKIWLYHYENENGYNAQAMGFRGFIKPLIKIEL